MDVNKCTYKATGVIIPQGLGIPKRFQNWICLQDFVLHSPASAKSGQILHGDLRCLSLSGTALTAAIKLAQSSTALVF